MGTQLACANSAFAMLGENSVTALNDGSARSNAFNALWQNSVYLPVMAMYPWNVARKRVALAAPSLTITGISVSGTTVTLTVGTNSLEVGQKVYVASVNPTSFNGTFVLTAVTSTTVSYTQSNSDTYVSGGTLTWAPLFDYDYVYTVPADCVRVIRVNQIEVSNFYSFTSYSYIHIGNVMPPFKIENGTLLSNESTIDILYVSIDNSGYTPPDDPVVFDLLATKAAAELAFPLSHDPNIKATMDKAFQRKYLIAKNVNAMQGTPDQFQETSWITSRA